MQWVWKNVFSNELHVEQLAIIGGGPLVGNLMDNFPRVPAYICLNVVQVFFSIIIYSSRVVNFPILISFKNLFFYSPGFVRQLHSYYLYQ